MLLKPNMTILFQGDSITDCGRDRENSECLGAGYPHFIAAALRTEFPTYRLNFINRGISGNTSAQMLDRWEEDCIALKPNLLSILIGVNDTWRRYDEAQTLTTAQQYEDNYRAALTRVREALGNIPIVILEPFLLPFTEDKQHWREDLDPRLHVARKLAKEFDATYIPLDGLFAQQAIASDSKIWSADGVHPTDAGHMFITENWLNAVLED